MLSIAGARLDPEALLAHCRAEGGVPTARSSATSISTCSRISPMPAARTVIAASAPCSRSFPSSARASPLPSLRAVTTPVTVVGLERDELVPFALNAAHYARAIPRTARTRARGRPLRPHAGGSEAGRLLVAQVCVDRTAVVDRAAVHARVAADAVAFFDRVLRARTGARTVAAIALSGWLAIRRVRLLRYRSVGSQRRRPRRARPSIGSRITLRDDACARSDRDRDRSRQARRHLRLLRPRSRRRLPQLGRPALRHGEPEHPVALWETVRWAFTTFQEGIWHPLTWLSLALDHALYGLTPRGFHLTNLLLHVANTVLVFLVWARLTGRRRARRSWGRSSASIRCTSSRWRG